MKKAIFYTILAILLLTTVSAKTVTEDLGPLESVIIENQNITLIDLDNDENKAILCVNGVKTIVKEDISKTVNNLVIEIRDVTSTYIDVKLSGNCDDCVLNNNINCLHTCNSNLDCNDDNDKTTDYCIGSPRNCFYENLQEEIDPIVPDKPEEITIQVNIEKPKVVENTLFDKLINWLNNLFR
jgi:hypothetical protein